MKNFIYAVATILTITAIHFLADDFTSYSCGVILSFMWIYIYEKYN